MDTIASSPYLEAVRRQKHVNATQGFHQLARVPVVFMDHLFHDPAIA